MQIKDNYLNRKSPWLVFARVVVILLALYFIYWRVESSEVDFGKIDWPEDSILTLLLVFALMIINWSLEAWRWQWSLRVFENISFRESISIVLGGLALNWVAPLSSGDIFSRLSQMKDKYQTVSAMVINRGIMLMITFIYGIVSVKSYSETYLSFDLVMVGVAIAMVVALALLRKRFSKFLKYFQQIKRVDLIMITLISIFRYAIFVFQFFLLLDLFLPHLPASNLLLGIGWIFFFKSMLPSVLGGLGVREASGLLFFSEIGDPRLVIVPTFLVWVINTVMPSVAGLIAISSWRLPRKN